jgi:hypothetical protein
MMAALLAASAETSISITNNCHVVANSVLSWLPKSPDTRHQQGCCPAVLLLLEAVSYLPTCLVQLAVTLPGDRILCDL